MSLTRFHSVFGVRTLSGDAGESLPIVALGADARNF